MVLTSNFISHPCLRAHSGTQWGVYFWKITLGDTVSNADSLHFIHLNHAHWITALCHPMLGAENTEMEDPRYYSVFHWLIIFICICRIPSVKAILTDLIYPPQMYSRSFLGGPCSTKKSGPQDLSRPGLFMVLRGLFLLCDTGRAVRGPYAFGLSFLQTTAVAFKFIFPSPFLQTLEHTIAKANKANVLKPRSGGTSFLFQDLHWFATEYRTRSHFLCLVFKAYGLVVNLLPSIAFTTSLQILRLSSH